MKKVLQTNMTFYPSEKRLLKKLAKAAKCRTLSDLVRDVIIYRRIPVPQVDSQ